MDKLSNRCTADHLPGQESRDVLCCRIATDRFEQEQTCCRECGKVCGGELLLVVVLSGRKQL